MNLHELFVAILTNNQLHAARDKQSCIKLDITNIRVLSDVEDVAELLRRESVHLILIDAAIKDMDGCACLKALRKLNRTAVLPAIMVTPDSSLHAVRGAIAAGCNGYVIRPYSLTTLERHLQLALATMQNDAIEVEQLALANDLLSQGRFEEAIREFTEITDEDNESAAFFDKGMRYLHEQKYGKAILAFNRAIALNAMFAEAYRGMAQAYQGKGDETAYRTYLGKSAEILALQDRLDELKELFVEILQADPEAVNPYNTMGIDLRRKGDYPGALHAYTQALHLTPRDENLHYNIAKACCYSKDYDRAIHHLKQATALRANFTEAERLLANLRAKQYEGLSCRPQDVATDTSQGSLAIDL